MARNGSGTYSKVNTFVAGNTVTAAGHNQNWDDLVAEMTNSVAADGQTTISAPLKGANGTAAAPSYGFASDPNTGVYRHGADELGFATGGTLAGWFDSAQKFWPTGIVDMSLSTSHAVLPTGTTGQRPGSPAAAMVRFNSTTGGLEFYNGSSWVGITPPAGVPQGRLTLVSGTPVMVSDQSGVSTVYYTPYNGNLIPLYDGTGLINNTFAELSMVMSGANFAANGIYDLFVASDAGTLRLAIGPVWGTLTAGSGARGTGAGTTELERKLGIWTNKNSITLRYASGSTFTAAANQATYVGSIFLDGTNSQVSCHVSYGQSRKWGLWNAHNRVPITLIGGDPTASWTNAGTLRASNADSTNKATVFTGLPEEVVYATFSQNAGSTYSSATGVVSIAIGLNSIVASSGKVGSASFGNTSTSGSGTADLWAEYQLQPTIGINAIQCLETGSSGTTRTWFGTSSSMILRTVWRG